MPSRIRRLIVFPLIMISLAVGWNLFEYDFGAIAPIEKVEVEGEFENISPESFKQKVTAIIDAGYFELDLDMLRTTLLEYPWVDDVSVRRQWPSSIHIKVKEKRAVAYWNKDAMISDRGEVFRPDVINNQLALPKLNGPDGLHNKAWLFLVEMNKSFYSMGFEVVDLNLDERRAWNLHFFSREASEEIEVKLGRYNVENRLARFAKVFSSNKFDLKNTTVIDLRYPNGFAIKIKNNIAVKQLLVREA